MLRKKIYPPALELSEGYARAIGTSPPWKARLLHELKILLGLNMDFIKNNIIFIWLFPVFFQVILPLLILVLYIVVFATQKIRDKSK